MVCGRRAVRQPWLPALAAAAGLGVAGAEDDSGSVAGFDGAQQRTGQRCAADLFLPGVLLGVPLWCRGHVVDDEQATGVERGDGAVEAVAAPGRRRK